MPKTADKVVYFIAPVISAIVRVHRVLGDPVRAGGVASSGTRPRCSSPTCRWRCWCCWPARRWASTASCSAGWASGSTYPLLGGLRSSAQMISYEVAMGLSIVAVFMTAGTMSTSQIVAAQAGSGQRASTSFGWHLTAPSWYAILLLPSFIIYCIAAVGETNRAPFDLPEAESELVGGFHTEYSSLKFALFFLAEYINMVTVSALCTTLFLGGWRAPWPITHAGTAPTPAGWPLLWFIVKVLILLFVFVWLRATLPRLRYDQFMRFGWKVLHPGQPGLDPGPGRRPGRQRPRSTTRDQLARRSAASVVVVLLVALLWPASRQAARAARVEEQLAARPPGSFPVPPMDLQVPPSPRARRAVAERQPATVGGRRRARRHVRQGGVTWARSPARSRASGSPSRTCSRRSSPTDYPFTPPTAGAALPRPAHPQPAPGRPGEVHRLRAVRLGLPGRRDLRRGRRQHRRAALLAR